MPLPIEYSVYSAHDYLVLGLHHLQVALQTQTVAPHSHVEHEAERYDDGCHNVQPLAFEGACMGALRHHGVHAQVVDDSAVARVAEVFYYLLQLWHNALHHVVGLVLKEDFHPTWCTFQTMRVRVLDYLVVHLLQLCQVAQKSSYLPSLLLP